MRQHKLQNPPKTADERMKDYLELISLIHAIKATMGLLTTEDKKKLKEKGINFCDNSHLCDIHIKSLTTGHPWNHRKLAPAMKNIRAVWATVCSLDEHKKSQDVVLLFVKGQLNTLVQFLQNLDYYYSRVVTEV